MGERTVKVSLVAEVSNYLANMNLAQKSTTKLGDSAIITAQKQKAAARELSEAFLTVGAVAAVAVGLAVEQFAKFDAKMSEVSALTGANAAETSALTNAALEDGLKLGLTAEKVADAEIALFKATDSVKDTVAGLPAVLTLAAASGEDVGTATTFATSAMHEFGLEAKDLPQIADVLVSATDKSQLSISDLSDALHTAGPEARAMGVDLKDTVGTLAAFSAAGLTGTASGTVLRQTLIKLANPSSTAKKELDLLGLSVFDAQGKFVGFSNFAGQLQTKLGGLTTAQRNAAIATIFGARAVQGANALYAEGVKGVAAWAEKVDETGAASAEAHKRLDNLDGDLKILKASFETDLIETGSGANSTLRELTQVLTGVVVGIGKIPQPVSQVGLALGTIVGITALVTGGFLKAVPAFISAKETLQGIGVGGRTAVAGIGSVALAATALVIVLAGLSEAAAADAAQQEALAATLNQTTGAITGTTTAAVRNDLSMKQLYVSWLPFLGSGNSGFDSAQRLGLSLDLVTKAAEGNTAAYKKLQAQTAANGQEGKAYEDQLKKSGLSNNDFLNETTNLFQAIDHERGSLSAAQKETLQKAEADKEATSSGKSLTSSLGATADAAGNADAAVNTLAQDLSNFAQPELNARDATLAFEQSLADATSALQKNGATLDIHTQKGRDNAAALDKIASSANDAAAKVYAQTGSISAANAILDEGKQHYDAFLHKVQQAGGDVSQFNDEVIATPSEVEVSFHTAGIAASLKDIDAIRVALHKIGVQVTDFETSKYIANQLHPKGATGSGVLQKQFQNSEGGMYSFADGGYGSGFYKGRPGALYRFAEPEVPWELFVSGKASARDRNRSLVMDAAQRLDMVRPIPAAALQAGSSSAPTTIVHQHTVTVPLTFSGHIVGNDVVAARALTDLVQKGVNAGIVSAGWNDH